MTSRNKGQLRIGKSGTVNIGNAPPQESSTKVKIGQSVSISTGNTSIKKGEEQLKSEIAKKDEQLKLEAAKKKKQLEKQHKKSKAHRQADSAFAQWL